MKIEEVKKRPYAESTKKKKDADSRYRKSLIDSWPSIIVENTGHKFGGKDTANKGENMMGCYIWS